MNPEGTLELTEADHDLGRPMIIQREDMSQTVVTEDQCPQDDVLQQHTTGVTVADRTREMVMTGVSSSNMSQSVVVDEQIHYPQDGVFQNEPGVVVEERSHEMMVPRVSQDMVVDQQEIVIQDDSQQVVLVTVPDTSGGDNDGNVEIIVTTCALSSINEHVSQQVSLGPVSKAGEHYEQMNTMSSSDRILPQSVCDYNKAIFNRGNHSSTHSVTVATDSGDGEVQGLETLYSPVDNMYNQQLSSAVVPALVNSTDDPVYDSAVSSGIISSAFQSALNTVSTTPMISLTRFPGSPVKQTDREGGVPLQSSSSTVVARQQTSVISSTRVQQSLLTTTSMTPQDQALYEKQETMKSLELVDAQWKTSVMESPSKSAETDAMFLTENTPGEGAVFGYKVIDINAEQPEHDMEPEDHHAKMEEEATSDLGSKKDGAVEGDSASTNDARTNKRKNVETVESGGVGTCKVSEPNEVKAQVRECGVCHTSFSNAEEFVLHMMQHSLYDSFMCDHCGKRFVDKGSLSRHKLKHSRNLRREFHCKECHKSFTTNTYLKSHMRTHTGEKIHACDECDERFTFSNMLRRHKFKVHKDSIRECPICNKEFVNGMLLEKHLADHEKQPPEMGDKQDMPSLKEPTKRRSKRKIRKTTKMTAAKMRVKNTKAVSKPQTRGQKKKETSTTSPVVSNVPKPQQFSCMICQEKFSSKLLLKKHARTHLGQRILRCDKCGKVFQDSIKLKMHKLSHTGQTFMCDFCGKSFSYASTLNMHKKRHAQEKGVQCNVCGKRFATADILKTHKTTHTTMKAYVCDVCEKAFTSQYYLKAHKRIHTGEKHYGCLHCGESFMFSTGLRRHVIKEHGGITSKKTPEAEKKENSPSPEDDVSGGGDDDIDDIPDLSSHNIQDMMIGKDGEILSTCKIKVEKGMLMASTKDQHGMLECGWCGKKFQSTPALNTHMKEHVEFPHTCHKCNKTFSRELYLQKHLQRHNDDRPHHCEECGKSFRSASYLAQHQQIHTGEKSYQCQLCGQEFIFANSLRRHLKTHTDLGPNTQGLIRKKKKKKTYRPVSEISQENVSQLNCTLCGYTFKTVSQVEEHLKTHSGENPIFECNVCKKEFNSHRSLWRHKHSHVDNKPISCEICNKSFRTSYYLKSHMNAHNGAKPYKCKFCDLHFTYASTRRRHQRTHIPEECMNFMCNICGKKFYDQCDFDRHMLGHSGEKPFMCDVCGKTFATKALLRSHLNRHNGEKQYKCQICNKTFLYHYRLKRHIKTHNAVKAFKCDMCDKGFLTQAYLSTHLRSHTGEKPYKCEYCNEEFSFSNTFRRHKRIHTGQTLNCSVCGKMCLELFDLKRHMMSHSDLKPVMCDICGKTFSHHNSCKRHMKRIHPEMVLPFNV